MKIRIGIDASNLRYGGGLMHISELLKVANPCQHGFKEIIVWAGKQTLVHLPADKPWLTLVNDPLLDKSLPFWLYWQSMKLPNLAKSSCDILFAPGISTVRFKPYVTMSQNLLPFEFHEMKRYGLSWISLRLLLLRIRQTKVFRKANGIIFLSEFSRRRIIDQIGDIQGLSTIIPHGIEERFFSEPKLALPLSKFSYTNPFKILYVSIVEPYKHQWEVAKAVALLRQKDLPVEIDFIGPAYSPALKQLKKVIKDLDPKKEFLHYKGSLPFDELHRTYHRADMFIFASSCETFGMILLESMAAGLPIACSQRSAIPEVSGDCGVYFDPEKPESIAEAIHKLVEDTSLRARCAKSAFERAKIYSWEKCAFETFALLKQVAQKYYNKVF